jgi:hypothetical protein
MKNSITNISDVMQKNTTNEKKPGFSKNPPQPILSIIASPMFPPRIARAKIIVMNIISFELFLIS